MCICELVNVNMEFPCVFCSKKFGNRNNLTRHVRINHRSTTTFRCYYCNLETKFKSCLSRHITLQHISKQKPPKANLNLIECPLCKTFSCASREKMISHYVNTHDVTVEEQRLEFDDFGKFLIWKEAIEEVDVCQYSDRYGPKDRREVVTRYYRCFRDGFFRKRSKGLRQVKSIKVNGVCPASIKTVKNKVTGVICVTYVHTHVGHSQEVGRMNLSKSERAKIAGKLASGIPDDTISDSVRDTMKSDGVKRHHLTTRKDVWNVERSFNLRLTERGFIRGNDQKSVEVKLVQEESEQNQLNEKKMRIRKRFDELMEDVQNDKHAEILWKALLPIGATIRAHSS
uniref:C2H2-type domain-containing protein n=1 Tax=Lygus hesperus TaxID=30085 RepID=A0A146LRP1_LYGHE